MKHRRGRPPAEAIAVMRSLVVVETEKLIRRPLERRAPREVLPPKGHAPVFMKNRPLQPLDEFVSVIYTLGRRAREPA